jgi:hypothetical protein
MKQTRENTNKSGEATSQCDEDKNNYTCADSDYLSQSKTTHTSIFLTEHKMLLSYGGWQKKTVKSGGMAELKHFREEGRSRSKLNVIHTESGPQS